MVIPSFHRRGGAAFVNQPNDLDSSGDYVSEFVWLIPARHVEVFANCAEITLQDAAPFASIILSRLGSFFSIRLNNEFLIESPDSEERGRSEWLCLFSRALPRTPAKSGCFCSVGSLPNLI
jgi:hypothetical protein